MIRISALALFSTFVAGPSLAQDADSLPEFTNLEAPEHDYWKRPLDDAFTRFLRALDKSPALLDTRSDKTVVKSVLDGMGISASSQLLLFSKTSLQLNLISPRNPRALYFNDEVSVGYIPGGKIEVASVDPNVGVVFHMFEIPRGKETIEPTRTTRCMNCHADVETREVPGFVIKSVIPGPNGGSLDAFRSGRSGHQIPLAERFGGYYLTGKHRLAKHQGNQTGYFSKGEIITVPLEYGTMFDVGRYLASGSDILPHLIREHQAGFTNRVIEAAYLSRTLLARSKGRLDAKAGKILDERAAELVRYILFADEADLSRGGIEGDPVFQKDFIAKRKADSKGRSLRDLDLKSRLFRHRCSYMIYGRAFQALPTELKSRVEKQLRAALQPKSGAEFAYLPAKEKAAILEILRETYSSK